MELIDFYAKNSRTRKSPTPRRKKREEDEEKEGDEHRTGEVNREKAKEANSKKRKVKELWRGIVVSSCLSGICKG